MPSNTATGESTIGTGTIEVAKTVTPEVKVAVVQALLSEGPLEVSEVLRDRRDETLALVQRLLASAGIEGTFSTPKHDEPHQATVELSQTGAPDDKELSPEQAWFSAFKRRFNAFPQLHKGIQWTDVEKSLRADPDAMRKLQVLDEAGFEMNVFCSKKNCEIQFRTAQTDVSKIAPEYRTIMYDKEAQADYPQYNVNGNAEEIAASLGVEVADPELYEQLRVGNGWVWLKTDKATRKTGDAFRGNRDGTTRSTANYHHDGGSFCAALRVLQLMILLPYPTYEHRSPSLRRRR